MRFAGTWSRYSKKAMPQLATAAQYHGFVFQFFKCAYHANVMNAFEKINNTTVLKMTCMAQRCRKNGRKPQSENGARTSALVGYAGNSKLSPTLLRAMRSRSLAIASSSRSIGSPNGSSLNLNVR